MPRFNSAGIAVCVRGFSRGSDVWAQGTAVLNLVAIELISACACRVPRPSCARTYRSHSRSIRIAILKTQIFRSLPNPRRSVRGNGCVEPGEDRLVELVEALRGRRRSDDRPACPERAPGEDEHEPDEKGGAFTPRTASAPRPRHSSSKRGSPAPASRGGRDLLNPA